MCYEIFSTIQQKSPHFIVGKNIKNMNCSQAQKIPIRKILESFFLFPGKEYSNNAFYYALNRDEKTPSLYVDFTKNFAFDFGTGKKYDGVSIVQEIKKCSISDALKYLEEFYISNEKLIKSSLKEDEKNYNIIKVYDEIFHPALLEYLNERKVLNQKKFLKEIHFEMKNSANKKKKYFALGFQNNSGGYDIRNKFWKGCLGKKDLTLIENNGVVLKVFEGFFDFLSYKTVAEFPKNENEDYLVLNSISMINFADVLFENYHKIELFLDNDSVGNSATNAIKKKFPFAEDKRDLYRNFKDLNEWICS